MTKGNKNSRQNSTRRTTRRAFLSVTGAGILGLTSTKPVNARPQQKKVPKYYSGGEVVEWMRVPKSWFSHNEHAKEALNEFNNDYFNQNYNILETGLIRSRRKHGGWNGFAIEAIYHRNKQKPDLPETVSGIRVHLREGRPEARKNQACKNTGDFSQYPGGVNISDNSPLSSTRSWGTSGYRVKDGNGNDYMVSASHIFDDCNIDIGDNTYQESNQIGEVKDGNVGADYIVTDDSAGNVNIVNEILEPDGTRRFVNGCASECEIDRRVSDAFDGYTKIGITTGKETGGLGKKNITIDDCHDLQGEGIRGSTNGAAGDSGGPWYSVENGDAFILAHHSKSAGSPVGTVECKGTQEVTSKSIGMPCFWIENNTTYFVESS